MATQTDSGSAANSGQQRTLKFGVVGIGNAGGGVLSMMQAMPGIEVVAAADLRQYARDTFEKEIGGRAYDSLKKMCEDPDVEAIWIATPNPLHCPHSIMASEHGKHVVVEKPMALSLEEAEQMIAAADKNGVKLFSGHTRAFDPAVQAMGRIIRSGEIGSLKAMNVWAFTNWMLRPRMPEEVDVTKGGGVAFRQAPHQIDTLRFLGGGKVRSIRGMTSTWMAGRMGAPGYFSAYMEFEDGTPATVTYNGYGYFMASELLPWESEPQAISPDARAKIRKSLQDGTWNENQAKDDLRFGGTQQRQPEASGGGGPRRPRFLSDLGLLLVMCERGMLRQSPEGLYVYDDNGVHEVPVSIESGPTRSDPTLDEVYRGVVLGEPIFHDGAWGMATLEVQLALMQSAKEHREISLSHQVAVPDNHG
jgi:phthalate 4,5-cis-dihydrodiol dehydrogenase